MIIGILLWHFTHESGIHATIAGVLLACTIPHRKKEKDFSLLVKIEHAISPYVAFGIMPLFAFANAGVSLEGISFSSLLHPVPLGILLGLFIGKQIGVFLFSYVSIKLGLAQMPNNSNWIKSLWSWYSNRNWFYYEFICWKFSLHRKYSIHGRSKIRSAIWVTFVHISWIFFDIKHI